MLNDADISIFKHVYVFVGRTDLRKGINGLSTIVKEKFHLNPFEPGNLFLFCGTSSKKIKGLVWEGDGFLLLYKRIEAGSFKWPRTEEEARSITQDEFRRLMAGYSIDPSIKKTHPSGTI